MVHSKSGRGDKYMPFRDDDSLLREVVLVRTLAEHIIEKSSEVINLDIPF